MRLGFTLIEMLMVIAVVAILAALLLPAIAAVRRSVSTAQAVAMIQGLQAAFGVYAIEDHRHWLPPAEADDTLRTALGSSAPRGTLDLLRDMGAAWREEQLGPVEAAGRALTDAWSRAVRYRADAVMDGVIAKPAPRADWNAKGQEPYAYVWSLGRPSWRGDVADADASWAEHWIYTRTTP